MPSLGLFLTDTGKPSLIEKLLESLNISGASNTVSSIILSLAIILFAGFLMTRLTKLLKLPNVTAYIITGLLIGPFVLNVVPQEFIERTEFLSDIALAFIAFSAGEFFRLDNLKKAGSKVIVITLFESLMAFGLVLLVCTVFLKIDLSFSIVLAALSSATAPASTIMTIRQTRAKGDYVNTLLEVVALDDVVTLLIYSIAISVCIALTSNEGISFANVGWPIIENLICLAIGFVLGFVLKFLLPPKRTTDNRLIIVIAVLLLFCGICSLFGQSPLLGCMAIGMVYTNTCKSEDKLFLQVNYFTPPIMLMFFVRSGMNFNLSAFTSTSSIGATTLLVVAIVYFFTRIVGKYLGAFTGSLITKSDKKIRNFLGMGLVPQAGVAIGLAAMGSRIFIDSGNVELGGALSTIILASSVLYELIGPGCSKLGLYLSKSYSNNLDDIVPDPSESKDVSEVDKLILQINDIRSRIPQTPIEEDEEAFIEAADEYIEENNGNINKKNRFLNR